MWLRLGLVLVQKLKAELTFIEQVGFREQVEDFDDLTMRDCIDSP